MEEDLISVIVPVYNVEGYLAACLDSILNQSYRFLEIIVINDGSTDFSLKIAETYAQNDDRIKVYSYENSGLSMARNHGLDVATGNLITFVDSDDLLLPDALEVMISYMKSQDADLVEGEFVRGKIYKPIPTLHALKSIVFSPQEAISDALYQKNLLPSAWGKLYKKELFDGLRFEKAILYEDLNIFYKLFERCNKIVWTDFPVYFYRITDDSITNTWKSQRLDVLRVTEQLEDYIAEKYPSLLPAAKDRRLSANFNMFALCSINGDKENAVKCWNHIKNYRNQSLFNPKVRIKNKTGILLSYFGKRVFRIFSRIVYK